MQDVCDKYQVRPGSFCMRGVVFFKIEIVNWHRKTDDPTLQ